MSNTYREHVYRDYQKDYHDNCYSNARDGYQAKNCSKRKRKMSPFAKKGTQYKFETEYFFNSEFRRTGYEHKEEIRNANRSLKKGRRQELKKDLKNEIENLNCE